MYPTASVTFYDSVTLSSVLLFKFCFVQDSSSMRIFTVFCTVLSVGP